MGFFYFAFMIFHLKRVAFVACGHKDGLTIHFLSSIYAYAYLFP